MLQGIFDRGLRQSADRLYLAIVEQARQPAFYGALGVPDDVDGRFELIALHAYVVFHCLKEGVKEDRREGGRARRLSQRLFDTLFDDMDRSLREMGFGDLAVGRQVKSMAKGLYGRIAAYDQGLAADNATLEAALARNLYGTSTPDTAQLSAMAAYLRQLRTTVMAAGVAPLLEGEVRFASPHETGER